MPKGGGKAKGRPRKIPVTPIPAATPPSRGEKGECSYVSGATETVKFNEIGESVKQQVDQEITASIEKQREENQIEEEKEATARQIEEGKAPLLRNRGMNLGYIAPIVKDGIPTALLRRSELEKEAEKWQNAIILYVIGDTPTISYLQIFLQKQCLIEGKIDIFYHTEGYFVVRFENRAERDKMLYEGPYTISNRPIIVKEWDAEFSFEKEVLREIPLWIRLPKLPLNCWSGDSLSRIGSVIGKPICADECTSRQNRISYARLLVEIDITQPLQYKIQVENEEGKTVEQRVYYEWVPMFCQTCQRVGHVCKEKPMNFHQKQQKQWIPKDKGKEEITEPQQQLRDETGGWTKPKHTSILASIQVGNIRVPTSNAFQGIEANEENVEMEDITETDVDHGGRVRGGDPLPFTTT